MDRRWSSVGAKETSGLIAAPPWACASRRISSIRTKRYTRRWRVLLNYSSTISLPNLSHDQALTLTQRTRRNSQRNAKTAFSSATFAKYFATFAFKFINRYHSLIFEHSLKRHTAHSGCPPERRGRATGTGPR